MTIFSDLSLTRRSGLAAFSCRTVPLHCLTGLSLQTCLFQFVSPLPRWASDHARLVERSGAGNGRVCSQETAVRTESGSAPSPLSHTRMCTHRHTDTQTRSDTSTHPHNLEVCLFLNPVILGSLWPDHGQEEAENIFNLTLRKRRKAEIYKRGFLKGKKKKIMKLNKRQSRV